MVVSSQALCPLANRQSANPSYEQPREPNCPAVMQTHDDLYTPIPTPPHIATNYVSSPYTVTRALACISGKAFENVPRLQGNALLGLLPMVYTHELNGVIRALWNHSADADLTYGWIGHRIMVCLRTPSMLRQVLGCNSDNISRLHPNFEGPFATWHRLFGGGVLTDEDAAFPPARHRITRNFFHEEGLARKFDGIYTAAKHHVDRLAQTRHGHIDDLEEAMITAALDILCRTQFGIPEVAPQAALRLSKAIDPALRTIVNPTHLLRHGLRARLLGVSPGELDNHEKHARKTFRSVLDAELLAPHAASILASDNVLMDARLAEDDIDPQQPQSITRRLLQQQGLAALQTDAVYAQAATVLIAGHETTASLLTWTLYELLRHPNYLSEARAELHKCGLASGKPDKTILENTPYLTAVLQETLRLHPPVPESARTVRHPFTIQTKHGNLRLDTGTILVMSMYSMHRDSRNFGADACDFKPERFLDATRRSLEWRYVPFTEGKRRCPGFPFALLEAKCILTLLISRFDLTLENEGAVGHRTRGSLKTKEPLRVQLRMR